MIKYQRVPFKNAQGYEAFRYLKNNLMTKQARIPHEVIEKFEYTSVVEYDELPDKRRCICCDAPQSRGRYLNGKTVELCEYHYQHLSLGKIAEQVRLNEEEAKKKAAYEAQAKAERSAKWHASHKKKKRSRKTVLSAVISTT